jgi:hypothetical protein
VSSSAPDLLDVLRADRRRIRADVALHAGRVLVIQPEQFEPLCIGDVLLKVPYVSYERARGWLREAGCDPWRKGSDLREQQRVTLARQLARFAREGS